MAKKRSKYDPPLINPGLYNITSGDLLTIGDQADFTGLDIVDTAGSPQPRETFSDLELPTLSPGYGSVYGEQISVDHDSYTKYIDRPFSYVSDDADDMRAYKQSFGEKALYSLPKFVTEVGTNVAGSTIGLLYGGAEFVGGLMDPEKSATKQFFDNDFQRSLDGINEWMDDKLPHYYTKEEQDYNFFRSMGTANFWFNDFTQGASFVTGAVLSELLTSGFATSVIAPKATKLLQKMGAGKKYQSAATKLDDVQKGALDEFSKSKTYNAARTLRQLGTGAMYEGGVEARHHYDHTLQRLEQEFQAREGRPPSVEEQALLVDIATKSANAVFAGNVALVGYGNYMMFPKIFGKGFKGTKSTMKGAIKEEAGDHLKKYTNLAKELGDANAFVRNSWRILKTPLYEGFVEEGGQRLLDIAGQDAASDYLLMGKDPTHMEMVGELMNKMDDNFLASYGSTEGQKEIGIGFILAALGVPTYSFSKNKKEAGWKLRGGIYNTLQDMKARDKAIEQLIKDLNTNPDAIRATRNAFDALVKAGVQQDKIDVSMLVDNINSNKNAEQTGNFNLIISKLKAGLEDSLRDDVNAIKNMDVDTFRNAFKYLAISDLNDTELKAKQAEMVNQFNEKIDQVKQWWNEINSSLIHYSDEFKTAAVYALSMSQRTAEMEDTLTREIKDKMKNQDLSVAVPPVENENKAENDKVENDNLMARLKNVWNRLTNKQKETISKTEEANKVKQRLGIYEFTDPTHLEEYVLELAVNKKALIKQIEDLQKRTDIDPKEKEDQLGALEKKLADSNQREIYLRKALQEGLEPDLSRQEQELLDRWRNADPQGYAQHAQEVIQKMKDLRLLRARRHRAIDFYNQIIAMHSPAVREEGTWTKKGRLLPRPAILKHQMLGVANDLAEELDDRELRTLFNMYQGKVIEFNYTRTKVTIGDIKRQIDAQSDYQAAEILVKGLMNTGNFTQADAWREAAKRLNVNLEEGPVNKTYRIYVRPEKVKTGKEEVLVELPDQRVLDLLREKRRLENFIQAHPKNELAKKELEKIEFTLNEFEKLSNFELNFLKSAQNIKIVDDLQLLQEKLGFTLEATKETIEDEIIEADKKLQEIRSLIKTNVDVLEKFYEALANGTYKTNKRGFKYITIEGTNYSEDGVIKQIAKIEDKLFSKDPNREYGLSFEMQMQSLENKLDLFNERLAHFHEIETDALKSRSVQELDKLITDYVTERTEADDILVKELKESGLFDTTPLLSRLGKLLMPDEKTLDAQLAQRIYRAALQMEEVPQEVIDLVNEEIQRLRNELDDVTMMFNVMRDRFITWNQDGKTMNMQLKYVKAESDSRQLYAKYLNEIKKLKRQIKQLEERGISDLVKDASMRAQIVLQKRQQFLEKQYRIGYLREQMVLNFQYIADTINNYKNPPQNVQELSDLGIDEKLNPENTDLTRQDIIDKIEKAELEGIRGKEKPEENQKIAWHNRMPITTSLLRLTTGSHAVAESIIQELDQKISDGKKLSPEEQIHYNQALSQLRWFDHTASITSENKDDYRVIFVTRNNIEQLGDTFAKKIFFYNYETKSNKKRYAKNRYLKYNQFKTKKLGLESEEDIKAILVTSEGRPVLVKGENDTLQAVYTSINDSNLFETNEKGETYYKYSPNDLDNVSSVNVFGRNYAMGTLNSSAQAVLESHKLFRQSIINSNDIHYSEVSGTTKGMVIWGEAIDERKYVGGQENPNYGKLSPHPEARVLVSKTTDKAVKDVDLRIVTTKNGMFKTPSGTTYLLEPGVTGILMGDRFVELRLDTLNEYYATQIYRLLRLYSGNQVQMWNGTLTNNQASLVVEMDARGQITQKHTKPILRMVNELAYFGEHTKTGNDNYKFFIEKKPLEGELVEQLVFDNDSIELTQLAELNENTEAAHARLINWLRTQKRHQINGVTLNEDITSRHEQKKKYSKDHAIWRKAAAKNLVSLKGKKGGELKKAKEANKAWRAKNPEPKLGKFEYQEFSEFILDENLNFSEKKWANYTEFLLSEKGRSVPEVPVKVNMRELVKVPKEGSDIHKIKKVQVRNSNVVWQQGNFSNLGLYSELEKKGNLNKKTKGTDTESSKEELNPSNFVAPSGLEVGKTYDVMFDIYAEDATGNYKLKEDSKYHKASFTIRVETVDHAAQQVSFTILNSGVGTYGPAAQGKEWAGAEMWSIGHPNRAALNQTLYAGAIENSASLKMAETQKKPFIMPTATLVVPPVTQTLDQIVNTNRKDNKDTRKNRRNITKRKRGGVGFNVSMPYREWGDLNFTEEKSKAEKMLPTDENGNSYFPIEQVLGLINGENYAFFETAGRILVSDIAPKGAIYHETYHAITLKLLSPEQRQTLYNEVRSLRGKAETYEGVLKNLSSFTNKEADEWLADEFREYALANGEYTVGSRVKKSFIQKLFDFLFKFFSNLNNTKSLFKRIHTGYYHKPINEFTTYTVEEGVAMKAGEISPVTIKEVVDNMSVELFNIAASQGIEFKDLFLNPNVEALLGGLYGNIASESQDTVYYHTKSSVEERLQDLYILQDNTVEGSAADFAYQKEVDKLEDLLDILEDNWGYFVTRHQAVLNDLKIKLDKSVLLEHVNEQKEDNKEDEGNQHQKNEFGESNEIDPSKTISVELRLLLSTLPASQYDSNNMPQYITNKSGLYATAEYAKVLMTLYKNLSNQDSAASMLHELGLLAQQDPTYAVLAHRLGLLEKREDGRFGVIDMSRIEDFDFSQARILQNFLVNFNKAQDDYLLQIQKLDPANNEPKRYLVNANQERVVNLTKAKWSSNFKGSLAKGYGVLLNGRHVLDKTKQVTIGTRTQTIGKWLEGRGGTAENLAFLKEVIGIDFTNEQEVIKMVYEDSPSAEIFNTNLMYIFDALQTNPDITDLYNNTELHGNLLYLQQLEAATNREAVSLQLVNQSGTTIYGLTQKHFINILKDKLMSDPSSAKEMLKAPNLWGSIWLNSIAEGGTFTIKNMLGLTSDQVSSGVDISKTNESNIASIWAEGVLNGIIPLIQTGNKKTSRAIEVTGPHTSLKLNQNDMIAILQGYLISEIVTANHVRHGKASNVKGLHSTGTDLQIFKSPQFAVINTEATRLIRHRSLLSYDHKGLLNFINSAAVIKELEMFLVDRKEENRATLFEYGILAQDKGFVRNLGFDHRTIKKLFNANINEMAYIHGEAYDSTKLSDAVADRLIEQFTYLDLIGKVEQVKLLLGNAHLIKSEDLFKRTSIMVGTKDYPMINDNILNWMNVNMPNLGSQKEHSSTVTTIVRKDPTIAESEYLGAYRDILIALGREDLIPNVNEAYTNMEIFDGGGFIHLDFYRSILWQAAKWTPEMENTYQKLHNDEVVGAEELALLPPIKPQVYAPFIMDGIHLRKGDKFALYPVHPMLSKTVTALETGEMTVMDAIYDDMTKHGLDYITFESSTKIGAVMNNQGEFPLLMDMSTRTYTPLLDNSSIMEYDREYFGIQIDPATTRKNKVAMGTQLGAGLFTDIYHQGELNPKFRGTEDWQVFSEQESWDQVVNRYHNLQSTLIQRNIDELSRKLGFVELPDGSFRSTQETQEKLKQALLDELDRRDLPSHTRKAILTLFGNSRTGETTPKFINQLFEKNKIETILKAIVTNSVIKRKMTGDQLTLQSNVGYELQAVKQKDADLPAGLKPLKFYRKDPKSKDPVKSKTLAMQVYLPADYRNFFKFEPGEIIDISKLDENARRLIGFRIPTEGMNSVEFIEIVDFLPQWAGNNVIVPSEMVGKSGADYDIDKLTLYFPNIYIDPSGQRKLVTRIEGVNALEHLEILRKNHPETYMAAATALFQANEDLENLQLFREKYDSGNLNELEYIELSTILVEQGFDLLSDVYKQPKEVLENELQDLMRQVLSHPLYFDELISPVGAFYTKRIAKEIQANKVAAGLRKEESTDLVQQLQFGNMVKTAYTMWSTLGGTGVLAQTLTNIGKSQRANVMINTQALARQISGETVPYSINFMGQAFEKEYLSISRVYDVLGNKIVPTTKEYVTGYVDGEKDWWVMYINAGKNTAGIHTVLLRLGVPFESVAYFMSQPIIDDFIKLQNQYQGAHRKYTRDQYMTQKQIVELLGQKYGVKTPKINTVKFTTEQLQQMLYLKPEQMTSVQKEMQIQVLGDFLNYKQLANDLRQFQQITAYDTTKLKNGSELIYLEALSEVVDNKNIFINRSGITGGPKGITSTANVEIQDSYISQLAKIFRTSPTMLQEYDLKNANLSIRGYFVEKAKALIEEGRTKDDIIYYLTRFDDHLTSFFMQTESFSQGNLTIRINENIERLFQGVRNSEGTIIQDSLPKRLAAIKRQPEFANNEFLNELLINLQEYQNHEDFDFTYDSMKLYSKRYNVDSLDYLADDFTRLHGQDPDLARDIMMYSIIKSGTAFSPSSFFQAMPATLLLEDISFEIFAKALGVINSGSHTIDDIHQDFIDNYWDNPRIVHNHYSARFNALDTVILNRIESGFGAQYVRITSLRNKSDVGAGTSNSYYNHFYELVGKEGDSWLYRKRQPKGISGELIQAGVSDSIINKHHMTFIPKSLKNVSEIITKQITNGSRTILDRVGMISEGHSLLDNGVKINVVKIGGGKYSALKKYQFKLFGAKKQAEFDKLLASRLGYKSIESMKKDSSLDAFFKNKKNRYFYNVERVTPNEKNIKSVIPKSENLQVQLDSKVDEVLQGRLSELGKTKKEC